MHQVILAYAGLPVLLVQRALPEQQDLRGLLVQRVLLVLLATQVLKAYKDFKVYKVILVLPVQRDLLDQPVLEILALQVQQGLLVQRDQQVPLVTQVHKVFKGFKDFKATQEPLVLRVLLDLLEPQGLLVQLAHPVLLEQLLLELLLPNYQQVQTLKLQSQN